MSIKSSMVIAKMLKSEGFSDHVQNAVEKYWMTCICRNRKPFRKLDRQLHDITAKLDDGEKLILGKFISAHKRMSFDTGLRIGLTTFARKTDKEYDLLLSESERASTGKAEQTEPAK